MDFLPGHHLLLICLDQEVINSGLPGTIRYPIVCQFATKVSNDFRDELESNERINFCPLELFFC